MRSDKVMPLRHCNILPSKNQIDIFNEITSLNISNNKYQAKNLKLIIIDVTTSLCGQRSCYIF